MLQIQSGKSADGNVMVTIRRSTSHSTVLTIVQVRSTDKSQRARDRRWTRLPSDTCYSLCVLAWFICSLGLQEAVCLGFFFFFYIFLSHWNQKLSNLQTSSTALTSLTRTSEMIESQLELVCVRNIWWPEGFSRKSMRAASK